MAMKPDAENKKTAENPMFSTVDASGATRVRTEDPLLAKQMRYQLRHSPNGGTRENAPRVGPGGLEPPT